MEFDRPAPRLAVAASLAAVAVFGVGGWLAAGLQPAGYAASRASLTVLTAPGTPHRWVAVGLFVVTGLLVAVVGRTLPGRSRASSLALVVAGVALVLVGILPRGSGVGWSVSQAGLAILAAAGLALWPALGERPGGGRGPALGERPGPSVVGRSVSGVLVGLASGAGFAVGGGAAYGILERVFVLAALGCLAAEAIRQWWRAGRRLGSVRAREAAALALVAGWCLAAGVVTTVVWPVTTSTTNFQARVSLSPDPRDSGRVTVETVLGDVRIDFAGLAPGLRVVPQVKGTITETVAARGASIEALKPTAAEQRAAIEAAAWGLGIRLVGGASVAALIAVAVGALWRRQRPGPRTIAVALGGIVLAIGGVGGGAAATYRSATPTQIHATGLLGVVKDNVGLFDDVAARSAQVTPYLRNLVALSAALQERYQPQEIASGRVLRVLLVSDIHAADFYPLMKSIIESEDVDLVIDAGDLVNFGTEQEGVVSGIYAGIASLGVPYLFVRGNHDATSPTDTAVLDRLARIPNVILLQPNSSVYDEVTVAGISIAGFNDARYYGDSGTGSVEKSQPPKRRWMAAFAQRPAVDVVVSHEPWAVEGIPRAGVLINGHMHTAYREGNRLQAGTFTGGGPLSHFVAGPGSEELVGQPSAFDLLDFGPTCRLTAVRRYRFTNVIEGRPAFDDVSLVNGSAIDTRPVDPLRRCSGDEPLQIVAVPAPVGSGAG